MECIDEASSTLAEILNNPERTFDSNLVISSIVTAFMKVNYDCVISPNALNLWKNFALFVKLRGLDIEYKYVVNVFECLVKCLKIIWLENLIVLNTINNKSCNSNPNDDSSQYLDALEMFVKLSLFYIQRVHICNSSFPITLPITLHFHLIMLLGHCSHIMNILNSSKSVSESVNNILLLLQKLVDLIFACINYISDNKLRFIHMKQIYMPIICRLCAIPPSNADMQVKTAEQSLYMNYYYAIGATKLASLQLSSFITVNPVVTSDEQWVSLQQLVLQCIIPAHVYSCIQLCWIYTSLSSNSNVNVNPGQNSIGMAYSHRTLMSQILILYHQCILVLNPSKGMGECINELIMYWIQVCSMKAVTDGNIIYPNTFHWWKVYHYICIQMYIDCLIGVYYYYKITSTTKTIVHAATNINTHSNNSAEIVWFSQLLELLLRLYTDKSKSKSVIYKLLVSTFQLCTQLEGSEGILVQYCSIVKNHYSKPSERDHYEIYYDILYTLLISTYTSFVSSTDAVQNIIKQMIQSKQVYINSSISNNNNHYHIYEYMLLHHICTEYMICNNSSTNNINNNSKLISILSLVTSGSVPSNYIHKIQLYLKYVCLHL